MNIQSVKQLRQVLSKTLNSLPVSQLANGRYTSLAKTTLESARMDLGDLLKYLGEPYPYNDQQHAPADVTDERFDFSNMDDIERFKMLRNDLQEILDTISEWYVNETTALAGTPVFRFKIKMSLRNAYTGINYCKKWLGMELAQVLQNRKPANA